MTSRANPHVHQVDMLNAALERTEFRAGIFAKLRAETSECPRALTNMVDREIEFCTRNPNAAASRCKAVAKHINLSVALATSASREGEAMLDRMSKDGVTGFDLRIAANAFAIASASLEGH